MDSEHIKFQITKIRQALTILKENSQSLMAAMDVDSPVNPNKNGRLDRIIKEFIVIKIAALIDKDKRTFSLVNLKNSRIDAILQKYKAILEVIKKNRDKAFGHHEKDFIVNEEIMATSDLFSLPLKEFLGDIEKEL